MSEPYDSENGAAIIPERAGTTGISANGIKPLTPGIQFVMPTCAMCGRILLTAAVIRNGNKFCAGCGLR